MVLNLIEMVTVSHKIFIPLYVQILVNMVVTKSEEIDKIDIIDLTKPTIWKDLSEYYAALEKHWKMCINCGTPNLGTAMHLEHSTSVGSMHPAIIPPEYLLTRLNIVDVSILAEQREDFVLTLETALKWVVMRHDPRQPTLLLFKFGWKEEYQHMRIRSCVCKIPGISYELAEWISANLSHVVGVATDAPTLESEETREFSTRTISNLLGKSGVYMIENVHLSKKKLPEHGCMAVAMPLKLLNMHYVPTRLTAFCPTSKTHMQVAIALKQSDKKIYKSRVYDVNLDEILN